MSLLDKLEQKFGRIYIPNLTVLLVFGQAVFYVLALMRSINIYQMLLIPADVLHGQVWRLFSFPFVPPMNIHPLFFAFALMLFYQFGTALEGTWGEFRFNVFILIGYLLTVAASFVTPHLVATNAFIATSVFLAFAYLYPDFELLLFFILPVKVRWLAWLTWIGYGLGLLSGPNATRLAILASIGNFMVFFLPDLIWRARRGGRRTAWRAASRLPRGGGGEPFHRCVVCGRTDQTNPEMLFRYCSACEGNLGYCEEHFANHAHVKSQAPQNH